MLALLAEFQLEQALALPQGWLESQQAQAQSQQALALPQGFSLPNSRLADWLANWLAGWAIDWAKAMQ